MSGLIFTVDIVINQMCNFAKKGHIFYQFLLFFTGKYGDSTGFFLKIISSNNIGKINFIQSFEETILYFLGLAALCIGRKHKVLCSGRNGTPWDTLSHFSPNHFFYKND